MLLRSARSLIRTIEFCRALGKWKRATFNSIRPASIFERSSTSLIKDSKCCPEKCMSLTYSHCLLFNCPNICWSSSSEKPMIAFSGVRNSCDIRARNSDLCWLAISASSRRRRSSFAWSLNCSENWSFSDMVLARRRTMSLNERVRSPISSCDVTFSSPCRSPLPTRCSPCFSVRIGRIAITLNPM